MPTPTVKGVTTISWGSKGLLTDAALTSAVVESLSVSPKNDLIEIEDGDGFTLSEVLLKNGFDADVKVLHDSAITWPAEGATVALKRPGDAVALSCLLVSIAPEAGRKKEAYKTFKLAYRPGVAL